MQIRGSEPLPWRRSLRRELVVLVALKIAALALLWWLFFSPAHRVAVDVQTASRWLGVTQPQAQRRPEARLPQRSRDPELRQGRRGD